MTAGPGRSPRWRRVARWALRAAGLATFATLAAGVVGAAAPAWSLHPVSTGIHAFPFGTAVGAVADDPVELYEVHRMAPDQNPRLVVWRSCLFPSPVHFGPAEPLTTVDDTRAATIRIVDAPAAAGCTTRAAWEAPPQTGTVSVTGSGRFESRSPDVERREAAQADRKYLESELRDLRQQQQETQARIEELRKVG